MPDPKDVEALRQEKYNGDPAADMSADLARLENDEPLAYVIGNIPFLDLSIDLSSRPLIPRPETEWWAEELCKHIGGREYEILDLCSGSGAIGLAVLKHCRRARVTFGELVPEHATLIQKNLRANKLDAKRADIRIGDLFAPFEGELFDIIVANPPYVPIKRTLPSEITRFEPEEALYAGDDGLSVIRRILSEVDRYFLPPRTSLPHGELWLECDISNIEEASNIALSGEASHTKIHTDPYGRPRLLVAYY